MDVDEDGLSNADEIALYFTFCLNRDSDNDGFDDKTEINAGTDPLNSLDFPIPPDDGGENPGSDGGEEPSTDGGEDPSTDDPSDPNDPNDPSDDSPDDKNSTPEFIFVISIIGAFVGISSIGILIIRKKIK